MPMLKMVNGAGTHIYPLLKSGTSAEPTRADLCVFVPDGNLNGKTADWVCTIEGENGSVVIRWEYLEQEGKMETTVKPATIRADQWDTVAVDVKVGRCKAWTKGTMGDIVSIDATQGGYAFYCNTINPEGSYLVSNVTPIILDWIPPKYRAYPTRDVMDTEDMDLALGSIAKQVTKLEAENKSLRAELDAANQRAAAWKQAAKSHRHNEHCWYDWWSFTAKLYTDEHKQAGKYRSLLLRTFPIIKDMAIAMAYDDVFGTSVSMGGELPKESEVKS